MELMLLALACGARFRNLGTDGLWIDEAYTAVISRQSLAGMRAALREDDAPALFYLCEKAVLALFGDAEWAVRLFPALCGCAAIVASWALLRRYAPRAALAGVVVTGFSSLAIFYSQQARNYSLLHMLTVLAIWALLRVRERPSTGRVLGLAAATLAMLHTHNLALWTVACVSILALVWLRARPRLALLFAAPVAIGAIPWALGVWNQLGRHQGANQWMSTWWETRSLFLAPFYSAISFLNAGATTVRPPVPLPLLAQSEHGVLSFASGLLVIAVALLAAFAFFRVVASLTGRRRDSGGADRVGESGGASRTQSASAASSPLPPSAPLKTVLLICPLAPLAGLRITHRVIGPSYVVARTDTMSLLPFLLLLALGWSRSHPALRTTGLALWFAAFLLPLLPWTGMSAPKGSDRALAAWIGPRVQPGDAMVVPLVSRPSFDYYGERQGWLDKLESLSTFPPIGDLNPAAAFPTPLDSLEVYREQAIALRESWERAGVGTVWCEAILLGRHPNHPQFPRTPAPGRERADANQFSFPTSLLIYTLIGLEPAEVSAEYRRDWMGGDRVLLAIPRTSWVPLDSLSHEVEIR